MSKSTKVVDLVPSEDGSYRSKQSKLKNAAISPMHRPTDKNKPKYVPHKDADEFLAGIDAGLDFVEAMKSRAMRIIGLRD